MLTCGATNGLHLASTTLLQNVDKVVIFVECPTYFIATDVLKKGGSFVVGFLAISSMPLDYHLRSDSNCDFIPVNALPRENHSPLSTIPLPSL